METIRTLGGQSSEVRDGAAAVFGQYSVWEESLIWALKNEVFAWEERNGELLNGRKKRNYISVEVRMLTEDDKVPNADWKHIENS